MGGFKISNDVGATVFAILSGLAALFLTAWIFGTGGCSDNSNPAISPVPVADGQNDAMQAALDEESARRAELAMQLEGVKAKNGELSAELKGLKGEIEEKNALLDAKLKAEADMKADADLQAKLKAARAANAKLKAGLDGAKVDLAGAKEEFSGIKGKLEAKIADLEKKLATLEGDKKALSLKMEGDAKAGADLDKLKADLAALTLKLNNESKASADAKLALDAGTKAAAQKEKDLNAEIAKLKASMSGDTGKLTADFEAFKKAAAEKEKNLNAKLEALQKSSDAKIKEITDKRNALTAEVEKLKKQLAADAKACDEAKKKLLAEIEKLKAELTKAKFGDKLKPAAANMPALKLPMLVNDPANLHANLQPLFMKLRGTADNPEALKKAYDELLAEGKSTPRLRIPFGSGSDEIAPEDAKKIADELKGTDGKVKFLAVGYASSDGDAESNYELSSRRASKVAEEIAKVTGANADQIQAVYFGQTKRFNSKYLSPNRIVEIWTVK